MNTIKCQTCKQDINNKLIKLVRIRVNGVTEIKLDLCPDCYWSLETIIENFILSNR